MESSSLTSSGRVSKFGRIGSTIGRDRVQSLTVLGATGRSVSQGLSLAGRSAGGTRPTNRDAATNARSVTRKAGVVRRSSNTGSALGADRGTGIGRGDATRTLRDASADLRQSKALLRKQTTIVNNTTINNVESLGGSRSHRWGSLPAVRVRYFDRPHLVGHVPHYHYLYRDRYDHLCYKIAWPAYRFVVRYGYGPYFTWRYVHPYYLRKYVFVSLGGYWPSGSGYLRYYWYGCHDYDWCGYYPVAREVTGDTYNYYTYNYYGADESSSAQSATAGYITPVDHTTFADVRERLAAQQPAQQTPADTYFEEAVKAFETADYGMAVGKFEAAMELAPEDTILPFAYAQALFADGRYVEAAQALRAALAEVSADEEGVFYPRGLYPDEEVLIGHIESLAEKARQYDIDGGLQLLLGYQLLGIGEIDDAVEPLTQAGRDLENADAAAKLLRVLQKIKTAGGDAKETEN